MSTSASLVMIFGMIILWGGLITNISIAIKKGKEN